MVAAKNVLGIEFPPRWNNSGARGFDRPSIAMGTGDSYDARKRVASVPLETGTDQQRRERGGEGKKLEEVEEWNEATMQMKICGGGDGKWRLNEFICN